MCQPARGGRAGLVRRGENPFRGRDPDIKALLKKRGFPIAN